MPMRNKSPKSCDFMPKSCDFWVLFISSKIIFAIFEHCNKRNAAVTVKLRTVKKHVRACARCKKRAAEICDRISEVFFTVAK